MNTFKSLKTIAISIFIIIVSGLSYARDILTMMPLSLVHDYNIVKNKIGKYRGRNTFIGNIGNIGNIGKYNKIIIILGESVNKNYMGIYNREYNTTPFFSRLKEKGEIYIYHAISPSNQTNTALSVLSTSVTKDNYEDFFKTRSFITDFPDKENS